jgi:hypothetical protein
MVIFESVFRLKINQKKIFILFLTTYQNHWKALTKNIDLILFKPNASRGFNRKNK